MDLDDLLLRTVTEVAALLRDRTVSSRELTEAALRRIERLDPLVNAVVVTRADEALADADRADAALAAGPATHRQGGHRRRSAPDDMGQPGVRRPRRNE
jgi:Asp-tRNA(Asn)/Glu-tRNA(Gln) amidotransferase A subunit family amidase